MKPLADLRRAVHSAAFLSFAPAAVFDRVAPALYSAIKALGCRGLAHREKRLADFTPQQIKAARRACARFAAALRAMAADPAEAANADLLLALAEDLDPL